MAAENGGEQRDGCVLGPLRDGLAGDPRRMNRVYRRKQVSLMCSPIGRESVGGSLKMTNNKEAAVHGGMVGGLGEGASKKNANSVSFKGGFGRHSGCGGGEEVTSLVGVKGAETSNSCGVGTVVKKADGAKSWGWEGEKKRNNRGPLGRGG